MRTLRSIRQSKGVTKKAVASHLGVARPTYNEYEENPQKMKIETALKLADFLNVDINEIFFISNRN